MELTLHLSNLWNQMAEMTHGTQRGEILQKEYAEGQKWTFTIM